MSEGKGRDLDLDAIIASVPKPDVQAQIDAAIEKGER